MNFKTYRQTIELARSVGLGYPELADYVPYAPSSLKDWNNKPRFENHKSKYWLIRCKHVMRAINKHCQLKLKEAQELDKLIHSRVTE